MSEKPQLQVETRELLERIQSYGGDPSDFTKIMAAALILASLSGRRDSFVRWMTNRCEVPTAIVDRWGTGENVPTGRVRSHILTKVSDYFSSTSS